VRLKQPVRAKAKVSITKVYDTTVNDEALAARMAPVLGRAPLAGASEDFSFFAREAPGLFVFLGVTRAART
jgi:metal-dependent amidase/aminoacylase/carboxypeptidase family protein